MSVVALLPALLCLGTLAALGLIVGRRAWGEPGEGSSTFAQVVDQPLVEHVEVAEVAAEAGAIGTVAPEVSDDLAWMLTARERSIAVVWEQAHQDHDLWLMGAAIDRAFADYETELLTRQTWNGGPHNYESTQQRIDRWLREGGDGVSSARAEVRQAVSTTWDAPSRELPLIERPDAQAVAEMLSA